MLRFATLLFATLLLAVIPAQAAEDGPETYETALVGDAARPASYVTFHASCGDECYAASLACDSDGSISFDFGDIAAEIAAAAITRENQDFALVMGGVTYAFFIIKLEYNGDMNGTWIVVGQLRNSGAANFANALGKAKDFKASIGSENLTLPVTADVKTWAAACVK